MPKKDKPAKSPLVKEEEKEPEVTPAKPTREYSIIVWGATGFTGQLVCQHIANDYPGHFKWAMAGRSKDKLEELRAQLGKVDPKCAQVPILTAELNDPKSLDKLVKQADVIISTAGPFWNIGSPMVDASLRTNTHYCDISGEIHWMHHTTRTLHDAAKAKNVKLVHSCGFDSIPSDLGVFMISQHMKSQLNRPVGRVDLLVNEAKGGFSGGSIQSVFAQHSAPDDAIEACKDVLCLTPQVDKPEENAATEKPEQSKVAYPRDQRGPRFNNRVNKWTYPFQFAPINTRVVYRSNALWEASGSVPYGPSFVYSEAHEAEGPVDAILGSMGHAMLNLMTTVPLLRSLIAPLLPEPGDGPPEAYRKRNHWKFTLHGWTQEEGRTKPRRCEAVVQGKRDPGYWETSRMVLESALCLALQGPELQEAGYLQGGVLTPATAMGSILIDRLNKAGITFEITKTGLEKATTPLDALKSPAKNTTNAIGGAISSEAVDQPLQPSVRDSGAAVDSEQSEAPIMDLHVGLRSAGSKSQIGLRQDMQRDRRRRPWPQPRRELLGVPMEHAHPLLVQPLSCLQTLASQGLGHVRAVESHVQDAVHGSWRDARGALSRSCTHVMQQLASAQQRIVSLPENELPHTSMQTLS